MRACGVLAAAILSVAATSAVASPVAVGGLPDVDPREAERAPLSADARAARRDLSAELGPLGDVRSDRKSGGVSYVGRTDRLLSGPSPRSPRAIVLGYIRTHDDIFGTAVDEGGQTSSPIVRRFKIG